MYIFTVDFNGDKTTIPEEFDQLGKPVIFNPADVKAFDNLEEIRKIVEDSHLASWAVRQQSMRDSTVEYLQQRQSQESIDVTNNPAAAIFFHTTSLLNQARDVMEKTFVDASNATDVEFKEIMKALRGHDHGPSLPSMSAFMTG